MELSVAL